MENDKKLLKITFLGTGTSQGIPMIASNHPVCLSEDPKDTRLRSSILISWDKFSYVIDCGPDFRQQMLREKIQLIHGVFFTHEHADHTAGLDDLRPFCYKIGDMPIYLDERTLESLELRFQYIFSKENRYPGAPSVTSNIVANAPFFVDDLKITPIEVMHGDFACNRLQVFRFCILNRYEINNKTGKGKIKKFRCFSDKCSKNRGTSNAS